jgi:uncharacterized protein (DUF1800 family)
MADTLRLLNEVDPADAWKPWQPTPADPWGRKWAAHLYRRAAFGPSREELLEAERLGQQGTLDLLVRGSADAAPLAKEIEDIGRRAVQRDGSGDLLRGWWLYAMLHSGHPLREKLTLFWHNHFATSIVKVQNLDQMLRQNCLLREHALGKFKKFLKAISKDPAMLVWLDSNSNVKGHPNENYARELMELFSLGVGHYTEKDVREAARAFTGWRADGLTSKFDAGLHDSGVKTVLGKTGPWKGKDIVRIVLKQPAAARFLVRKFYHFFISEKSVPPDRLLEPLCELFRGNGYDIAALVRTMLASRHFYSNYAFRQRVKSPVEYVLGAARAVYRPYREGEKDRRPLPQDTLVRWIDAMGQSLFAPPNVKGWPGGRSWLNTATVLERDNFAASLAVGAVWTNSLPVPSAPSSTGGARAPAGVAEELTPPKALDPARLLEEEAASAPEDVVRVLLGLYVPGGVPPEVETRLSAFVGDRELTGGARDQRVREAVHAILTMAEYQLA